MKKQLVLLFCVMLIAVCHAEDGMYATAGDLFQSWSENYPDYICGVWSTDGGMNNLTFSVMNNADGENGKAEILSLVEDDSTVTFEYGDVSRNYLTKVQEELLPYFEKDLGLSFSGVYDMENRIGLGILTDMKDNSETIAMLEEFKLKYGDIFFVEYTSEAVHTLEVTLSDIPVVVQKDSNTVWYVAFATAAVILTATFVLLLRKSNASVKTTNAGNVTENAFSLKDVEAEIKNAEFAVPSELDERIMNDVNK